MVSRGCERGDGDSAAQTDYRSKFWRMAGARRGSIDAAEYMGGGLGPIFLKYISEAFKETHQETESQCDQGADPGHQDEYIARSIFWPPPLTHLRSGPLDRPHRPG